MTDLEKAARMALEALVDARVRPAHKQDSGKYEAAITAIREALAEQPAKQRHIAYVCPQCHWTLEEQPAQQQEPVSIKSVAQKAGINLPETYIPTMDDAIAAGDSVLMNERAALLRECRAALDSLIAQKPTLAGLLCGSTTLGNLKAELGAYRPQGVFGTSPQRKPWVGLTDEQIVQLSLEWPAETNDWASHIDFARAIEAKLREKNA